MPAFDRIGPACVAFVVCMPCTLPFAAVAQPASALPAAATPLFAVEIHTGERWDAVKPPQEQAFFKEHSANLRRLRERGSLVVGARYADKGWLVLAAASESEARAMLDEDPSFAARVFRYSVSPLNVFYGGTVAATPRR